MEKQTWRNKNYRREILSIMENKPEILFFDTETTGLSTEKDRIIEIGAIKIRFDEYNHLQEIERFHRYIRPPFFISDFISDLTGITNDQLSTEPYEDECFDEILTFFGNGPVILGAHNTPFDVRMLNAMYMRNGCSPIHCSQVDTLEMARDILCHGETENHKLGTLARLYGLDKGISFHSAIDDVVVTTRLFEVLYKEYLEQAIIDDSAVTLSRPTVKSIVFWEGYKGYSRIYVATSAGSVYYDVRRKTWNPKDVDINTIDMEYVEKVCLEKTDSADIHEFARFTGRIWL